MISSKMCALMLVGLVATISMMSLAEAQSIPSCASKLTPCFNYLNSTNPPANCCDAIRDTVTNELPCLCRIYNDPNLLPSLGINVTQVLLLPRYCNINADLRACNAVAPSPSSRAPGPSSVLPPPAVPGGGNGSGNGSGAGKISLTGMSSVLLILASMMLFG